MRGAKLFLTFVICFASIPARAQPSSQTIVVGIAGGTGSGKTTFTDGLKERFGKLVTVVPQDNYYKDTSHLSPDEQSKVNFDHPEALDLALLSKHLSALKAGKSIVSVAYDKASYKSVPGERLNPSPLLVVEGTLVLAHEELRKGFDVKLFIDTDADLRILRRQNRDLHQLGRPVELTQTFYLASVKPMHEVFVQPSKQHAHVIIPGNNDFSQGLDLVVAYLEKLMRGRLL